MKQKFVISSWMKPSNVNIAIAGNAIFEAGFETLHLARGSENCRDRLRNSRILLEQVVQGSVRDLTDRRLGRMLDMNSCKTQLLGRRRSVCRSVQISNTGAIVPLRYAVERRSRGRLSSRVRATTILKAWHIGMAAINTRLVCISTARSQGEQRHRSQAQVRRRVSTSCHGKVVIRALVRWSHGHGLRCRHGSKNIMSLVAEQGKWSMAHGESVTRAGNVEATASKSHPAEASH